MICFQINLTPWCHTTISKKCTCRNSSNRSHTIPFPCFSGSPFCHSNLFCKSWKHIINMYITCAWGLENLCSFSVDPNFFQLLFSECILFPKRAQTEQETALPWIWKLLSSDLFFIFSLLVLFMLYHLLGIYLCFKEGLSSWPEFRSCLTRIQRPTCGTWLRHPTESLGVVRVPPHANEPHDAVFHYFLPQVSNNCLACHNGALLIKALHSVVQIYNECRLCTVYLKKVY